MIVYERSCKDWDEPAGSAGTGVCLASIVWSLIPGT